MDFTAKKLLVESISDEVGVLHPLLAHTLRHLDGVKDVAYTHGPNEKGADFVVTRTDQSLGTVGYVGVIAKAGKILSNFTDIERQIDECRLARTISGLLTPIRLSEVWIVNTSSISRNAQDKIVEKYASQKVQFIDGEKLTTLIDYHANYFWYDIPSDIGSYLQALAKRLATLDTELSVLQGMECENFYIDPDIQEFSKPTYIRRGKPSMPRMVNMITEVLRHRVAVLEGDMGFGKSRTSRFIANHYCAPDRYKQKPVLPIFHTFKGMLEKQFTLQGLLEHELIGHVKPHLVQGATYLFIIDGVDEAIKMPKWREFLQERVAEAHARADVHVLFTCRPLRFLDEQITLFSGTQRFLLRPLSFTKIVAFVERACAALSLPHRLFEDLRKSDLFKQLPQSPIAAALLSRLLSQNTADLPSNLTELYAKSIENLLGRWDIAKGGCTEKEYRDAERVTLELADLLVGHGVGTMSLQEAKDRIKEWHSKRNTNVPLHVLEDRVLNKSGIFLCDEEQGLMCFRHRSFGEFLYAKERDRRNMPIPAEESFRPEAIYIQFFYTGLRGDCEEHLRSLMAYEPGNEIEAWLKILLMPDYLLAGYQTPYSLTEENLFKLFIDAADLYLRIRSGETRTKLNELPEMHLLWFFQRIIRSAFEYDYFRPAIQSTILRIDQELAESTSKQYALFFASCFAAELDDPSGFEYMLKTYGTEKLPLQISIALKMEASTTKDFSKLPRVKEHDRKLNSLLLPLKGDSAVEKLARSRALDDLFEKPVRAQPKPSSAP